MSFFKKITVDAIPFKSKKSKKKKSYVNDEYFDSKERIDGASVNISGCTNVHIGTTLSLVKNTVVNNNVVTQTKTDDVPSDIPPKEVEEWFWSYEEATFDQFVVVSRYLTNGCTELGKHLGFTEEELCSYSSDDEGTVRLLIDWKRAQTSQATIGFLMKSLWDACERTAAIRLADHLKSTK